MTNDSDHKNKYSAKWLIVGCSILFSFITILVLIVLGVVSRQLFINVGPDEIAVLITPFEPGGLSEVPLFPGRHFLNPVDRVEIYGTTQEVYVSSSDDCDCGSTSVTFSALDGADVIIDYRVVYVINPEQVVLLHRTWQHRYQDEFVIPMAKQFIEGVAAKYPSYEIALIKRDEIEKEIFQLLAVEFSKSYLELFEFGIEDVRLSN